MLLSNNPFRKGKIVKLYTIKPKKPNSAQRKIAKVFIKPNIYIFAYIPGIGHKLQLHNIVLIRGGKTQDLPSFKYKIVRNVYDCNPVENRITSRSKYGVKK